MLFSRRFLVLAALMFWQGGFVFYAGVVVPIGTDVLGSAREQARITRRVTVWLNWSAVAALAPLGWDVLATRRGCWARRWRGLAWLIMAAAQIALFVVHRYLDARFDPDTLLISDRTFRTWHRVYLWVSSVQWGAGVVFAALTIWAWRGEDRGAGESAPLRVAAKR